MTAALAATERALPLRDRVIGGVLLDRAQREGDAPFIRVGDGEPLSSGALAEAARHAAGGFAKLGIGRGTPVALLLPNREEHLVAWFALALLGAVEVPINTALHGPLLAHVLSDSRAEAIVVDAALRERVAGVEAALPVLRRVIVVGEPGLGDVPWDEVAAGPAAAPASVAPGDPAAIMYTSGTTGPAKGVLCPHGYFLCWALDTAEAVRFGPGDVLYTPLPLFHITGQAVNVLMGLVAGGRVELGARFSPSGFWGRMAATNVTHVWAFGSMTPLLHRAEPGPDDRAHEVRVVWSIPWPAGFGEDFERRFGVRILGGYGSTEQGLTLAQPYDGASPDAVGRPTPHYDVRIVDESGRPVPAGEIGEIVTRPREPASTMIGYVGRPEATVTAWRDLWYHTGDRGQMRPDGFVRFIDRAGDAIRRRGENISAWEIESVVATHPQVEECAAIAAVSDLSEHDVRLVAVAPGVAPRALFEFCRDQLPYYMVPRYVDVVDTLPRTPSGRVQKNLLREAGLSEATWDCEAHGLRVRRPQAGPR
jgi:crotonobetaine/carnitine-CoA ligase